MRGFARPLVTCETEMRGREIQYFVNFAKVDRAKDETRTSFHLAPLDLYSAPGQQVDKLDKLDRLDKFVEFVDLIYRVCRDKFSNFVEFVEFERIEILNLSSLSSSCHELLEFVEFLLKLTVIQNEPKLYCLSSYSRKGFLSHKISHETRK